MVATSSASNKKIKQEKDQRVKIESEDTNEQEGVPMRVNSMWSAPDQKYPIPGLPVILPSTMTVTQVDAYVLITRLEEVSRKLRNGAYLPVGERRSVSPEPIFVGDTQFNTRESRYKVKLEAEKQKLIDYGLAKIHGFRPPSDYRRPGTQKFSEKIYIPIQDFPHVNFMGILIGPRGRSLKKMENDTGTRISIRGRGSVKEGKMPTEEDNDDLHCSITADSEEKVLKAVEYINSIIETATSVPDGRNELKKMQLRELAALNGTLREDDEIICLNCGETGHKKFECTAERNYTTSIMCRICGGAGHIAADCTQKTAGDGKFRANAMDFEYATLMAEISGNNQSGPSGGQWAGASVPWAAQAQYAAMGAGAYAGMVDPSSYPPGVPGMGPPGVSMGPPGVSMQYGPPGTSFDMGPPGAVSTMPFAQPPGYDAQPYYGYMAPPGTETTVWSAPDKPPGTE